MTMARRTNAPYVVFLQMPWATTHRPSIALAILTRLCAAEDVDSVTFYPNMDLSAAVGFETFGRFSDERALYGLSEHLFAVDIFGADALMSDDYVESFCKVMAKDEKIGNWTAPFGDVGFVKNIRDEIIPAFLDGALERVLAEEPDVVGFTSTFNQVMSSLALATRIKQADANIHVLAGGACFDGEMGPEYHRALPDSLDHVFLGEAEESFTEYLRRLKEGEPTPGIPGVTSYRDGEIEMTLGSPLADMEQSPTPDYDDFFAEAERLRATTGRVFNIEYLPFESSRGCWWGAKNHCVFCGINEELMPFRAKSVETVVQDLLYLSSRYRAVKFTATDWIISKWHCDELFQRLIDLDLDLELFYEVRPALKKAQIMQMHKAGILHVQPGIESLSTPLLRLMKKHSSAIRHVQFLRWTREIGVNLSYNILAGFPGEEAEWYLDMAQLIPRLKHLQPPLHNVHFIEMHRFAPLFEQRDDFDVDTYDLRSDYQFNFPDGRVDPKKIAYFFEHNSTATAPRDDYVHHVRAVIQPWIEAHEAKTPPVYEYVLGVGFMRIVDMREGEGRYLHLADLHYAVALLCDEVSSRRTLKNDLAHLYPAEIEDGTLDQVVDELIAGDVLFAEDDHLLLLPIGVHCRSTDELRRHVLGDRADERATGSEVPAEIAVG